jgi:hypothetical protein
MAQIKTHKNNIYISKKMSFKSSKGQKEMDNEKARPKSKKAKVQRKKGQGTTMKS